MKIYWSAKQVPGFKDLAKEEQKSVWQIAYIGMLKQWHTWMILVLVGAATVSVLPESIGSLRSGIAAALSIYVITLRAYKRLPATII